MDFTKYQNNLQRPDQTDLRNLRSMLKDMRALNERAQQRLPNMRSFFALRFVDLAEPVDRALAALEREEEAYLQENVRLNKLKEADMIEDVGLTGHPKAQRALELAYDRADGSGDETVLDELETLAALLK